MKKIISLAILLVILLNSSACAEDFVLFGNVPFGMKYETVEETLKSYGQGILLETPTRFFVEDAYPLNLIKVLSMTDVTIAGIEKSSATFAFNKENQVYQCLCNIGNGQSNEVQSFSREEVNSMYLALQKMLTKKYGTPNSQYISAQSVYTLYTFSEALDVPFTNCAEMINAITPDGIFRDIKCDKVSEWLVPTVNNDQILINLFIAYNTIFDKYRSHILYTYIPYDAIVNAPQVDNWL